MQKNRIELAGYLGAKPAVRYLPSGTPVANVRMAEGYRYTDRNNQIQEHTNWHSLVFYGDLADIAALFEKKRQHFRRGHVANPPVHAQGW
jgi:single-strand DNA-binding protein